MLFIDLTMVIKSCTITPLPGEHHNLIFFYLKWYFLVGNYLQSNFFNGTFRPSIFFYAPWPDRCRWVSIRISSKTWNEWMNPTPLVRCTFSCTFSFLFFVLFVCCGSLLLLLVPPTPVLQATDHKLDFHSHCWLMVLYRL